MVHPSKQMQEYLNNQKQILFEIKKIFEQKMFSYQSNFPHKIVKKWGG